jgi:hypothetical protein
MNRPVGLVLIALALTVLAIPFVAETQREVKTARIGYLRPENRCGSGSIITEP